jgi:hypothetical protein
VPLSQQNVATSAGNIAKTLEFSEADRGLNMMPLFHIHGLIAGLLAPLSRDGDETPHKQIVRELRRREQLASRHAHHPEKRQDHEADREHGNPRRALVELLELAEIGGGGQGDEDVGREKAERVDEANGVVEADIIVDRLRQSNPAMCIMCSASIRMEALRRTGWPIWRSRRGDDCRAATVTQAIFW